MEGIQKEFYLNLKQTFDRLTNGANAVDQNSAANQSWNMVMHMMMPGNSEVFISSYEQVLLQLACARRGWNNWLTE